MKKVKETVAEALLNNQFFFQIYAFVQSFVVHLIAFSFLS